LAADPTGSGAATGLTGAVRSVDEAARPTPTLIRLSVVSATFLVLGLSFARADVVVLAMPFAITLFLAVARRRDAKVSAKLAIDRSHVVEGRPIRGTLTMRATADLDLVVLVTGMGAGVAVEGGVQRRAFAVAAGEVVVVDLGLRAVRWGRTTVGPIGLAAWTAALAFELPSEQQPSSPLTILPTVQRFESDASLPDAVASAGRHRSRLRGDGMDFAGIRPFVYGDRLRRVNWRASRRLGTLQVVEAHTERSTEVVVLVDSGQDVGQSGGIFGAASSLDAAVRAAAALTAHYLARGDAVRLVDVGTRIRFLRRLAGRRDLVIASNWLLDTRLAEAGEPWRPDRVAALVPPRVLVLALTPLLDERMTTLVARLRQRGQPLVVVDTLPSDAIPAKLDAYERLGLRMWLLERERTVALLNEVGCPVVAWAGSAGLDAALRALGEAATAPRVAAR
jgi:uncharacterized protein (DUF58 family)